MSIATPVLLGTATGARNSPLTITPAVSVATGSVIIVGTDGGVQPASAATVTDTSSNLYERLGLLITPFQDPGISQWASNVTGPVTTTSTITITYTGGSSNDTINAVAIAIPAPTGMPPARTGVFNGFDQAASNFGYGSKLAITTDELAYGGELAVVYWASRQAQGAPELASDWTSIAQFQGQTNTHWVNMAWRVVQSHNVLSAQASVPVNGGPGWGGVVVMYVPLIVPTAELDCGGTATGFPVVTAVGTAALGCGGTVTGFDNDGPLPPPVQPVFPAGYGPLAADFGNWVQDAFGYCTQGIVFRAEQHASQAIPAATFTPLRFDTVLEDPWGGWSPIGTPEQGQYSWLVPWTGVYRITFRYMLGTSTEHWNNAALYVNGSLAQEAGGLGGSAPLLSSGAGGDGTFLLPLLAGDYVGFMANSLTASATDVSAPGRYASVEITATQVDFRDPNATTGAGGTGLYGPVYEPTY